MASRSKAQSQSQSACNSDRLVSSAARARTAESEVSLLIHAGEDTQAQVHVNRSTVFLQTTARIESFAGGRDLSGEEGRAVLAPADTWAGAGHLEATPITPSAPPPPFIRHSLCVSSKALMGSTTLHVLHSPRRSPHVSTMSSPSAEKGDRNATRNAVTSGSIT